jgi:hypothetical protein
MPNERERLVALVIGDTGRSRRADAMAPAEYRWRWQGSQPEPLGDTGSAEAAGDADLTLRLSAEDARLVQEGRLEPSVAFMQGRLKAEGDHALLLRVLAWSATPAFRQALAGQLH